MEWPAYILLGLVGAILATVGCLVVVTLLGSSKEERADLKRYQTAYGILQEKAVRLERRVNQLEKELAAEKKKIKVRRIYG